MADHDNEDLPGDAVEDDAADAEGEGGEDLSGLKSALAKVKAKNKALKEALADAKTEGAFVASLPKNLRNPEVAKVLAREFGLVKSDGTLDAEAFKKQFPEQFTNSTATANAGTGTNKPAKGGPTPNEWIRAQAGRK